MSSRLKKAAYRTIRYSPWTERLQNSLRRETAIRLDAIGVSVRAGPADIVIDAGANVGDVTSLCARTGATVHAFEPNPVCYRILEKRFGNLANVNTHAAGVMDKPCRLTLSTPKAHDQFDDVDSTVAGSMMAPALDTREVIQTDVECIDLADFIRKLPRPVTLLKMDIEGAEIAVLNHLIDTGVIERINLTVVETHERFSPELAQATDALRDRLAESGLDQKVRLDWY
jgi:FkbM family methyltransferase